MTEKQLQANRANAKKSTGPNTPRGKSISSQNAIKQGFLAKTVLLPGEANDRFLELKNAYLRDFQPETQDECDLVDALAVNRWRILRSWTFETVSLIHEQRRHADANATEDEPTQAMLARREMDNPPRSHEALRLEEAQLDRQYYRALDRLKKMVAERRANEKSEQRSHDIQQNKLLNFSGYPIHNPRESQISPKEDPKAA